MSGRGGRKRGRPPKTPNDRVVNNRCSYKLLKKPKYLSSANDSSILSPSGSRASSPFESEGGTSRLNNSGSTRKIIHKSRGRGRGRSSVNTSYSQKRNYESEYHYGSDFGDSSEKSDDDDILMSNTEEESINDNDDNDSDFSLGSLSQTSISKITRPPSPDPVWLQDRTFDDLELPPSSQDLLISKDLSFKALGIYEILRRFRHFIRLSPFRFEDFCGALVCEDQNALLTDIHIMLLKAILREEDAQGTHFSPLDQKDTVNIGLYLIDALTWPEVLRSYVESDVSFDRRIYQILLDGEYPYKKVIDRIDVLQFLTDQFITTNTVRDVMLQEGPIRYDDHCRICHRLGDLLCCETCPAVFHLECVEPPLVDIPTEDWQCNLCKSHKVSGVTDCIMPSEKQNVSIRNKPLGIDRHGRTYWFMARRIFIEDQSGDVWYYSTEVKFELLMKLLDGDDLEQRLYEALCEQKEEIVRQLQLTKTLTFNCKKGKKSYIELEAEELIQKNGTNTSANNNMVKEDSPLDNENKDMSYFKLGMEKSYKYYVNQYTTHPFALNKPQRNEERDKRRHLSHKFSLTPASDFKWMGTTMGTADSIITTIRQTLINFEQTISSSFYNPNWIVLKKLWSLAVTNSRSAFEFSTVLLLFQSSLKNVVFANVWHEQLGHVSLRRITAAEREERKKIEKREKRERDDEEERSRLNYNYIKYTLGLKHQVWKQKGEEYRVHGQRGWMWLSASRKCTRNRSKSYARGEAIKCHRINVHYKQDEVDEVACVDPRTYKFILQCEKACINGPTKFFKKRFDHIEVKPVNLTNCSNMDVIDVSTALTMPGRLLYPKVGRGSVLDQLLEHRIKLKEFEEKKALNVKEEIEDDKQEQSCSTISLFENGAKESQTFLEKRLLYMDVHRMFSNNNNNVNSKNVSNKTTNLEIVNLLAKKIQTVRLQFSQLNRFGKPYSCYAKECNTNSNAVSQITQNTCYSPICLQKARAKKELLLLLRKAHTAGNGSKETVAAILGAVKKPSLLEQKLNEGKRDIYAKDDSNDQRLMEERPFDIWNDWDQAKKVAIPYSSNLIEDCFLNKKVTIASDLMNDIEMKNISSCSSQQTEMEQNVDFVDPLDICSNVEVESSETLNDNVIVSSNINGIMGIDQDPELDQSFSKRTKRQKNKSRVYIGTKDVLDQTLVKDSSKRKQNRRFPAYAMRVAKREDVSKYNKEFFADGKQRIYSTRSPCGPVHLVRDITKLQEITNSSTSSPSTTKNVVSYSKYPLITNFLTHKYKSSLLVLPRYEVLKLARVGGKMAVTGFNHMAKNNQMAWPYPCPRPLFKTCWAYRTSNLKSLSAVALQLRILWCCLRWDDMAAKPPSTDGKYQMSSETGIVTLELLRLRHLGRYGERTQYLRRKVLIPLEQPKTVREVTSIRSGLRKRKRAESPQPTEPQISEEWVEEDKLELWEIKVMGEKTEKAKLMTTRSVSFKNNEILNSSLGTNSTHNRSLNVNKSSTDNKNDLGDEQASKIQKTHPRNDRRANPTLKIQGNRNSVNNRRFIVKNGDGTNRHVHPSPISKNKNILNSATDSTTEQAKTSTITNNQSQVVNSAPNPTQQRVQIVRCLDGKICVRGLLPTQQLVQTPDGKLHVLTTTGASSSSGPSTNSGTKKLFGKQYLSQSAGSTAKQIAIKQTPKNTIVLPAQKETSTNAGQGLSTHLKNTSKSKQGVQQIVMPSGQKVLLTQNLSSVVTQKLIGQQSQASSTTVTTVNQQKAPQMTTQQYVNTSNMQQQILVSGQRIILGPGQSLVTQRAVTSQCVPVSVQSKPPTSASSVVNRSTSISSTSSHNDHINDINVSDDNELSQSPVKTGTKSIATLQQQQSVEKSAQTTGTGVGVTSQQQIIVQNSTLAQQLAQGKLQVATVNGQQVIIKQLGNCQAQIVAHIKLQSDGNSHIVTTPNNTETQNQQKVAKTITAPVLQENTAAIKPASVQAPPQQQQLLIQKVPQTTTTSSIEESLLQSQPPGTVLKCVTAQVIQTDQGARIVLQGLVGNDFTQQQLALVQQQVKQQLLKAQESTGKLGVLGPTKIYLAVQPQANTVAQPPPLSPMNPSQQQQQQQRITRFIIKPNVTTANATATTHTITVTKTVFSNTNILTNTVAAKSNIDETEVITSTGTRATSTIAATGKPLPSAAIKTEDQQEEEEEEELGDRPSTPLLEDNYDPLSLHTSTPINQNNPQLFEENSSKLTINDNNNGNTSKNINKNNDNDNNNKQNDDDDDQTQILDNTQNFSIVTFANSGSFHQNGGDDIVSGDDQTIMNITDVTSNNSLTKETLNSTPNKCDEGQNNDKENSGYQLLTTTDNLEYGSSEQQEIENTDLYESTDIHTTIDTTPSANVTSNLEINTEESKADISEHRSLESSVQINQSIQEQEANRKLNDFRVLTPSNSSITKSSDNFDQENVSGNYVFNSSTEYLSELNNFSANDIKQDNVLSNYDNVVMERELNSSDFVVNATKLTKILETHKIDIKNTILKKRSLLERSIKKEIQMEVMATAKINSNCNENMEKDINKQQSDEKASETTPHVKKKVEPISVAQTRRMSKKGKEKLYCVCNTPYDDSKFYVGCDICTNWFHGDCVNITEEQSRNISEFICDECQKAMENQELYCLCREPYDEAEFYICCDKCQDWFHGRCVGIIQSEADYIDEYICPTCQKNNNVHMSYMKDLTPSELPELKKLFKQVKSHKNAWPFAKPVDARMVPDYYNVIKEPMDLKQIEHRINNNSYAKLSEFIRDMTKIFDNCRYYNTKESKFYKCAEALESFFIQKIKDFRANAAKMQND